MKKIISICLIALLAFGLLAGCGDNSVETDSDSQIELSTEKVNYVDSSGKSVYRIVRTEDGNDLAVKVLAALKSAINAPVKNIVDTNESGDDVYEILIGKTNRPETQTAKDYMVSEGHGRYSDYIIRTIGKKIVIYSDNPETLSEATDYFINNFIKKEGIEGGINYLKTVEGDFTDATINGVSVSKFKIVRPHYNSSYLTQIEMEKLFDMLVEKTGYGVEIVEDEYQEESDYEIVVGNTNRTGVEKIADYDHYNITVSGKKVYLNGGNTYSTAMAVSEFAKMISDGSVVDGDTVKNQSYKATYSTGYDATETYRPVWVDDFDGTSVDPEKWIVVDEEYKHRGNDGMSGQNGMSAWRKPENVSVSDGYFYAIMTKDDSNYYGGTLRTKKGIMSYKYGYVELSCITPQGSGFWSTLWMYTDGNADYMGLEIDVNECFGNSAVTSVNAHTWPSQKGQTELGYEHRSFDHIKGNLKNYSLPDRDSGNLNSAFHTFGFLWTEDYIAGIGDGKIYCDLDLNSEGVEDFKLAYNTHSVYMQLAAIAGVANCPLTITATEDEWENSNIFKVDYVHLYQLDDGVSQLTAKSKFNW